MTIFHCLVCRRQETSWLGLCPTCGRFNSFSLDGGSLIVKSTSPDVPNVARVASGIGVFDESLLGGIVTPSCVLVGGIAGAGKSTMLLQVAGGLAQTGLRVAYVCAEEDASAVVARARRVGATSDKLDLVRTTDANAALQIGSTYDVAIYDSIQKLGCTADMLTLPATRILVSQMNGQGEFHGERKNEHDPDVLVICDYNPSDDSRMIVVSKNRHGELKKAPYTLGEFGAVGMPCKDCLQCVVPCKCPPKRGRKRREDQPS